MRGVAFCPAKQAFPAIRFDFNEFIQNWFSLTFKAMFRRMA
jgi:hypothetical protein